MLNKHGEHSKHYPACSEKKHNDTFWIPSQYFCLFATYRASQMQYKKEPKYILTQ